jgi:hypothetical protein
MSSQGKPQLAGKMCKNILGIQGLNMKPWQKKVAAMTKPESATAGTDAALAALQNSLATENARKAENTWVVKLKRLPS